MYTRIRRKMECEDGFTMIELMVVIAILGILMSMVIPNLGGARREAQNSELRNFANRARNGMEMYYASRGFYPRAELELESGDELFNGLFVDQLTARLGTSFPNYDDVNIFSEGLAQNHVPLYVSDAGQLALNYNVDAGGQMYWLVMPSSITSDNTRDGDITLAVVIGENGIIMVGDEGDEVTEETVNVAITEVSDLAP